MAIIEQVQGAWKGLSKKTQRWLNAEAMVAVDAGAGTADSGPCASNEDHHQHDDDE